METITDPFTGAYKSFQNMEPFPDLSVCLGPLTLKNPVMTASGTFGYGSEFQPYVELKRLGAIVVKGLSLAPEKGNPPPRIVETPCGMLNAIGLENVGVEAFVLEKLPFLRSIGTPVIANIYGKKEDEYAQLAERLDDAEGVAGIEINISCPNVKVGGIAFGVDPESAASVVRDVRKRTRLPVIVKLSPNVTDIVEIALRAQDEGADILSLINTITGMAIDIERRRPMLANITGGLSGPAIRPVAVRMVWQVARAASIPVIGIGGVTTAADAIEFMLAGASAVQVGTANFVNPRATTDIIDGIEDYLNHHRIARVEDLVGAVAA